MSKRIYVDGDGDLWVLDPEKVSGSLERFFDPNDGYVGHCSVDPSDFTSCLLLREISLAEADTLVPGEHFHLWDAFLRETGRYSSDPGFYLMGDPLLNGERVPAYVFESGRCSLQDRFNRKEFSVWDISPRDTPTPSSYEEILEQTPPEHRESTEDWLDALCVSEEFAPGLRKDGDGDYFYMGQPRQDGVRYSFFMRDGYSDSWQVAADWPSEPISYAEALSETEHPEEFRAWCQRVCPELIKEKPPIEPGFYSFVPRRHSLYYYSGVRTWFTNGREIYEVDPEPLHKAHHLTYKEALENLNGDSDLLDCFVEDTDTWRKVSFWVSSSGRILSYD